MEQIVVMIARPAPSLPQFYSSGRSADSGYCSYCHSYCDSVVLL